MDGSATLTIVASRMTMNWARQTRTRTNQRFASRRCTIGSADMPPSVSAPPGERGLGAGPADVRGQEFEPDVRVARGDGIDRDAAGEPDADDVEAPGGEPVGDGELLGGGAGDAQLGARAGRTLDGAHGLRRDGGVGDDDDARPARPRVGARDRRARGESRRGERDEEGPGEGHTNERNTYDGGLQGALCG